ncbi:hypothetical protein PFISCL1PPCAC_19814, partial [Pristionchus fissidentatus]
KQITIYHHNKTILERKLGEEPLILAGLVLLLQTSLCLMERSSLLLGLLKSFLVDDCRCERTIDRVTGRKKMRVGDHLQFGLQLVSVGLLLLSHRLGDLTRIPVDSSNKSMRVGLVTRSLIVGFDNKSLQAGVFSSEDEDDLS